MIDGTYGRLASLVYERDKPVGTSFGDVEFYRDRLAAIGARRVLEPAIGTGRVLVPLARAGFAMSGFDRSTAMLARCRRALARHGVNARVEWAGFEDFTLPGRFDAIVIPAGSFQLLVEPGAAQTAAARLAARLRRGGRLLFDVDPAETRDARDPRERNWYLGGGRVILTEIPLPGENADRVTSAIHRYVLERRGRTIAREVGLFRLRWWSLAELETLLGQAGMRLDRVVRGYGSTAADSSASLTLEAIRA